MRKYKSGDKVGIVKVYLGDKCIGEENIYVKKENKKKSFWDKFMELFK